MATVVRATSPDVATLAAMANNLKATVCAQLRLAVADHAAFATHDSLVATLVDLGAHNDRLEQTITLANASDLPTSIALTNQLMAIYKFHVSDTLAHKAADAVDIHADPVAIDLASAIVIANHLKSDYAAHRVSTTYHYTADSTNATSASVASDQGTLNTLLNDLKTQMTAHYINGVVAKSLRVVNA